MARDRDDARAVVSAGCCSSLSTHRVLIARSFGVTRLRLSADLVEVFGHRGDVRPGRQPQCPGECLPANRLLEARSAQVQPRATPGQPALRIRSEPDGTVLLVFHRDHSQECRPAIPATAADTHAYGRAFGHRGRQSRPVGHERVYPASLSSQRRRSLRYALSPAHRSFRRPAHRIPRAEQRVLRCAPGYARSGLGGRGIRADVDPPSGELGRQSHVLGLLADGERQLVVGHDDARRPSLGVDDLHGLHPGR